MASTAFSMANASLQVITLSIFLLTSNHIYIYIYIPPSFFPSFSYNKLLQVNGKGFSEFAGLRSSSASLPFGRKGSDDFVSMVAFQTTLVSASIIPVSNFILEFECYVVSSIYVWFWMKLVQYILV